MYSPFNHRQSRGRPQGTRGTSGSPDNDFNSPHTPSPIPFGGTARQWTRHSLFPSPTACVDRYLTRTNLLAGMAIDDYLMPKNRFSVTDRIELDDPTGILKTLGMKDDTLFFGQDIEFGNARKAPGGQSVGNNMATLRKKMLKLLDIFAPGDKTGMAKRLFDKFLSGNAKVEVFEDADMNEAIKNHPNFKAFSRLTLAAPGTAGASSKKTRIHQTLRNAHWDINNVRRIYDLGVPRLQSRRQMAEHKRFSQWIGRHDQRGTVCSGLRRRLFVPM